MVHSVNQSIKSTEVLRLIQQLEWQSHGYKTYHSFYRHTQTPFSTDQIEWKLDSFSHNQNWVAKMVSGGTLFMLRKDSRFVITNLIFIFLLMLDFRREKDPVQKYRWRSHAKDELHAYCRRSVHRLGKCVRTNIILNVGNDFFHYGYNPWLHQWTHTSMHKSHLLSPGVGNHHTTTYASLLQENSMQLTEMHFILKENLQFHNFACIPQSLFKA